MAKKILLCTSANGKKIVYDPVNSHTATHFDDNPPLREIAREVLTAMKLKNALIAKDVDMGRTIGDMDVVDIDDTDELVYAMRRNRRDQGYVPFTKSRLPQPSSLLSIDLVKQGDDTYELRSAWIGPYESPEFPEMNSAKRDSVPFWSSHAFVWGSQEIIPGTEREDCPW